MPRNYSLLSSSDYELASIYLLAEQLIKKGCAVSFKHAINSLELRGSLFTSANLEFNQINQMVHKHWKRSRKFQSRDFQVDGFLWVDKAGSDRTVIKVYGQEIDIKLPAFLYLEATKNPCEFSVIKNKIWQLLKTPVIVAKESDFFSSDLTHALLPFPTNKFSDARKNVYGFVTGPDSFNRDAKGFFRQFMETFLPLFESMNQVYNLKDIMFFDIPIRIGYNALKRVKKNNLIRKNTSHHSQQTLKSTYELIDLVDNDHLSASPQFNAIESDSIFGVPNSNQEVNLQIGQQRIAFDFRKWQENENLKARNSRAEGIVDLEALEDAHIYAKDIEEVKLRLKKLKNSSIRQG